MRPSACSSPSTCAVAPTRGVLGSHNVVTGALVVSPRSWTEEKWLEGLFRVAFMNAAFPHAVNQDDPRLRLMPQTPSLSEIGCLTSTPMAFPIAALLSAVFLPSVVEDSHTGPISYVLRRGVRRQHHLTCLRVAAGRIALCLRQSMLCELQCRLNAAHLFQP